MISNGLLSSITKNNHNNIQNDNNITLIQQQQSQQNDNNKLNKNHKIDKIIIIECQNNQIPNNDDNETDDKIINKKYIFDKIPARLVLYFLSWSGFLVSFMMRNDINFALIAMVRTDNITYTTQTIKSSNLSLNNSFLSDYLNNYDNYTKISTDTKPPFEEMGEYDWSSTTKAAILGSFYWCYVLSQVVGGVATQIFGTKSVFGWSQFATAICSLFIPYAANIHYGFLIILRSIQGFASGLTWPAMYAIVVYWIPQNERSRFMSSFQGFSIGIGLTYPLCGFIIKNFGWRYIFYTTGTMGLLWCLMWYFLAFNKPYLHPRITKSELEYIQLNINNNNNNNNINNKNVPWKLIFKSLPVWSIAITTFGRIWVHYQFIMSGPIYMKYILGFSIQSNGLLTGLPFLCSYISSVLFCYITDIIVKHNIMTLTNIRKLMTAISQIIPGVMIFIIGYINNNIIIVLIIWFFAVTLITASYAGAMANIVDIAPNLAGPVLAFAQTIHMTASFLSPLITGFMVTNEKSIDQWRHVFGLATIITVCTYIMFQIYGTADVQSWNYNLPQKKIINNLEEENQMLQVTDNNDSIQQQQQHYQNDKSSNNNMKKKRVYKNKNIKF